MTPAAMLVADAAPGITAKLATATLNAQNVPGSGGDAGGRGGRGSGWVGSTGPRGGRIVQRAGRRRAGQGGSVRRGRDGTR